MSTNEIPQEERLLAALAHGSLVAGGAGIAVGVLIYVTRKETSPYAARQAVQAAVYQAVGTAIMVIAWILWTVFYFLTLIPVLGTAEQGGQDPPAMFWIGLGSMICPLLITAIWILYGLYGALRAWSGADFRYALVGGLAERLVG